MQGKKMKILIVDDSDMNREILSDMLSEDYEIAEAVNGKQALALLENAPDAFSLMLLDIVMPDMDGFELMAILSRHRRTESLPVIIISSETAPTSIKRAFEFGATDYISRPFDADVVKHRVSNTLRLYAKQKRLEDVVAEEMYDNEKSKNLMVAILSHIVESRNGESGMHVLHITSMTRLFLEYLQKKTDKYPLSTLEIAAICDASALHDIGKIAIPNEIINKPGRFTPEEFEIMKTHSALGTDMLLSFPFHDDEILVREARNICRWHHERWDGGGYPDGLVGDSIPISAQVVSVVDVYDALISERCYKKAYSHEEAIKMILNGECGCFNPLLLECLTELSSELYNIGQRAGAMPPRRFSEEELLERIKEYDDILEVTDTAIQLDAEREKVRYLAERIDYPIFSFRLDPPIMVISAKGCALSGLPETVVDPMQSQAIKRIAPEGVLENMYKRLRLATPESPNFTVTGVLQVNGRARVCDIESHAIWAGSGEERRLYGYISIVKVSREENA